MIRLRAELIANDKKCSQYFLNLEKCNFETKYIKSLINCDGNVITDPYIILKEDENFYHNLYNRKESQKEHGLLNCEFIQNLKKISEKEKEKCHKDITIEELWKNLKMLPNNKSPGCDGLAAEFYKKIRKILSTRYLIV